MMMYCEISAQKAGNISNHNKCPRGYLYCCVYCKRCEAYRINYMDRVYGKIIRYCCGKGCIHAKKDKREVYTIAVVEMI